MKQQKIISKNKMNIGMSSLASMICLNLLLLFFSNCNSSGVNEPIEPDPMEPDSTDYVELTVGSKMFKTNEFTSDGTPVVPMWGAQMPTTDLRSGAGFDLAGQTQHAYVWRPNSVEAGAYNHYSCLISYEGQLFAMWGNHVYGEDAPGQRVLFSRSTEWGTWTQPEEVFPAPGPVKDRSEDGIHLKADRWAIIDGTLYAIAYVLDAGTYPIARSVDENGNLGEPFLILDRGSELPVFMQDDPDPSNKKVAEEIVDWYKSSDQIPWWAWASPIWGVGREASDESDLIECFSYLSNDETSVLMMRNWGTPSNPVHNNRIYASFKERGSESTWSAPHPTNIPDSPSRAQAVRLDDGTILLIGNQNAPYFDEALYLDRDPMTVSVSRDGYLFDKVFVLRTGSPTGFRFPGIGGRNPGYAYSSSMVLDDWLYTLYSIGKEDIAITRVPLTSLGIE